MDRHVEDVRRFYTASVQDRTLLDRLCSPDVVFHVGGDHPLSGDHTGLAAVHRYVDAVAAAAGPGGGYEVTSVYTDDTGNMLLVEGTATHGSEPFVRTIAHLMRFADGRLVEFWDNPFDQPAEDRFWRDQIPAQRSQSSARPTTRASG